MFDQMTAMIREETVRMMLTLIPRRKEDVERKAVVKETSTSSAASDGTVKAEPVRKSKKVGPNDPCPCGSGKKYKKCCGDPAKKTAQ